MGENTLGYWEENAREGEREKITYGYWDNSFGKKLTCRNKNRYYFSVYPHK